nr:energy transducer TonB [Thalassotalea sp. Y01]
MPQIDVDGSLESQEFAVGAIKDNDARPIYRALPRYPIEAAREQIRGWVKLKFAVNRYGKIENIEVLDASPPEIFDQAAIDALQRWKYQAKVIDGKTVRQEGMSVRIDFGKK